MGGQPQSLNLKKVYITGKRGFKMDIFTTRMCFGRFWEQQKKFWDTKISFWNFFQKAYKLRGVGGQCQFGKSLHFDFLAPFPKTNIKRIFLCMQKCHIIEKSWIQETINLSACGDRNNDTIRYKINKLFKNKKKNGCIMCLVSCIMCQVSGVRCQVSGVCSCGWIGILEF